MFEAISRMQEDVKSDNVVRNRLVKVWAERIGQIQYVDNFI